MKASLRASLEEVVQKWLEENADEIGSTAAIWQDDTCECSTAKAIAGGAVAVFDGMEHQMRLNERLDP